MASTNSIVLFKLVSGEDIIARVKEAPSDDSSSYKISDPRMLILNPSEQGSGVQFGLAPWLPWMLDEFASQLEIKQDRLLVDPIESLPKEIQDGYAQQISGIQIS